MTCDDIRHKKWWLNNSPKTIGSIGSAEALCATHVKEEPCDIIEIRVDLLLADGLSKQEILAFWPNQPALLTVRCSSEGGAGNLEFDQRLALYRFFMAKAAAIDIELKHLVKLSEVIDLAREHNICVVGSAHSFDHVPDENWLMQKAQQFSNKVDIVKIAGKVKTLLDIESLTDWAIQLNRPFSIMGMGALGPISRIYAAQKGSILNYGFIGSRTAPGQWSSKLLKQAISSSEQI